MHPPCCVAHALSDMSLRNGIPLLVRSVPSRKESGSNDLTGEDVVVGVAVLVDDVVIEDADATGGWSSEEDGEEGPMMVLAAAGVDDDMSL